MHGNSHDPKAYYPLRRTSNQLGVKTNSFKGPSRVVRLCLFGVLLPTFLIALPLYLRYRVYGHQFYPLALSDMRIIDGKISTTWCQRQVVKANTTFNAFLLDDTPKISNKLESVSMVRHLVLEDDMKEYWGFYLLKGSIVKVSTCVRWPGASLIVIRGHKHLHECAYIGDNSSEEPDEFKEDGPANRPTEMRRHHPDVQFLQPHYNPTSTNNSIIRNNVYEEEGDGVVDIKKILDNLQNKTKSIKKKENHHHRNSTVEFNERNNFKISPPHLNESSDEIFEQVLAKLKKLNANKSKKVLDKINEEFKENSMEEDEEDSHEKLLRKKRELILETANSLGEIENVAQEEGLNPDGIAEHRGTILENTLNDMSNSEFWSSFSSSEEALLSCTGLILNLPLTPHHKCSKELSNDQAEETSLMNTITYKVPINGYYFFVFNSENEVQQNYLRVKFDMEKAVYNLSKPLAVCTNKSMNCALDLNFLSTQKVVLELPLLNQEAQMNEEFVAESECEPRSSLYAFCVILVPVVFIMFAFT